MGPTTWFETMTAHLYLLAISLRAAATWKRRVEGFDYEGLGSTGMGLRAAATWKTGAFIVLGRGLRVEKHGVEGSGNLEEEVRPDSAVVLAVEALFVAYRRCD